MCLRRHVEATGWVAFHFRYLFGDRSFIPQNLVIRLEMVS